MSWPWSSCRTDSPSCVCRDTFCPWYHRTSEHRYRYHFCGEIRKKYLWTSVKASHRNSLVKNFDHVIVVVGNHDKDIVLGAISDSSSLKNAMIMKLGYHIPSRNLPAATCGRANRIDTPFQELSSLKRCPEISGRESSQSSDHFVSWFCLLLDSLESHQTVKSILRKKSFSFSLTIHGELVHFDHQNALLGKRQRPSLLIGLWSEEYATRSFLSLTWAVQDIDCIGERRMLQVLKRPEEFSFVAEVHAQRQIDQWLLPVR